MTKLSKKNTITVTVAIATIIVLAIGLTLYFCLPRQLSAVTKIGKLDNVEQITYTTSACSYFEGPTIEITITDKDAINDIVKQFNADKMYFKMPLMPAPGSGHKEIAFKTKDNQNTIAINQSQIGRYGFKNDINVYTKTIQYSPKALNFSDYYVKLDNSQDILIATTQEEYINIMGSQNSSSAFVTEFETHNMVFVNLKHGSISREFYLTKIALKSGKYTLTIKNVIDDAHSSSDTSTQFAILAVPKDLNMDMLNFDIQQ